MTRGRARGTLAVATAALIALFAAPAASAATTPLSTFGTFGGGAGQLSLPMDVAISPDGTVSVAEIANNRLSQFNPDGTFIRAFGIDVDPAGGAGFEKCTTATGCKTGLGSADAGGLGGPRGVAVDPATGNLYATATALARVGVFDPDGDFLFAFGYDVDPSGGSGLETCTTATGCKAGVSGSGPGQLSTPTGIDIAGDEVFVSNYVNGKIEVYTLAGAYLRTIGTPGAGAGQLATPEGLTVVDGDVYVADSNNRRISRFTSAGTFVAAYGTDVIPGGTALFESCTTATTCQAAPGGAGLGQFGATGPRGLAVSGSTLIASDTSQARVQRFTTAPATVDTFGWDVDGAAPGTGFEICSATCQTGTTGNGAGQLDTPFDMELDCRGAIWIADYGNHRVQRFGEPGTPLPPDCPVPPVPSNNFTFGKVKKNKRTGTAVLPVRVPGAGVVRLGGLGIRPLVRRPGGATTVRLRIRARGKVKLGQLNRRGKVFVRARVRFTPTGGTSRTKTKRIRLVKRRSR